MLVVSALLFAGLLALALYLISDDVLRLDRLKDGKAQVTQGPYSGPATLEGGISAYDMGDYASAKRILLPLAENGVARAQNMIGLMYTYGHGVRLDESTGCDWYEKAANNGYASAMINLARCLSKGEGRAKNFQMAINWYDQANNLGRLEAGIDAALLYEHFNRSEYIHRLQIIAKEGHAIGHTLLWVEGEEPAFAISMPQEILCVLVMNFWLGYPDDHCDAS